jgi:hypothetical protein
MKFRITVFALSSCLVFNGLNAFAKESSPPLPLHGIEGYGGIASTYSAYLTNPAEEGDFFGLPSVGGGVIGTTEGRFMGFTTFSETLGNRLELGYGLNVLSLNELPDLVATGTGMNMDDDVVLLHNFNARLALLHEGDFKQSWIPAVTIGAHYKYNDTVNDIDKDLNGTLSSIGIEDNDGIDYTLYASKMFTFLPRPLLVNVGVRNSDAAHIGLLGFTGEREFLFEGNAVLFVTDSLALGAEYRQKPNGYDSIDGLIAAEDDWWSVVAAYVINDSLTVSGGYFNLGDVLDEKDTDAFAVKLKWEF